MLYKNRFCEIRARSRLVLEVSVSGNPNSDELKQLKNRILDHLSTHPETLILDYGALEMSLKLADQVWIIHEWLPKVTSKRTKNIGVLLPRKTMTKVMIKASFVNAAIPVADILVTEREEDFNIWRSYSDTK